MVDVFIEKDDRNTKVEAETVKDLLEKLNINSETVLVTRNDELILLDEKLNKKDEIKLLSVISGG